ncbi:MAG TPA: 16S rRNA (cytidine(1402)-2'-O)-methyltransferase [Candidatus Dormibacteraeota bacterium]|nr:16S rRNA (cytidine(1402)-2'-O)-methyltransferase [Candidatus Dormibacteraeota bacterium]
MTRPGDGGARAPGSAARPEGRRDASPRLEPGTLYVVATPIGNLEDITLRALRVLGDADAIVAEDSRRVRALLSAHGIRARGPVLALPAFDEARRVPALLERLAAGEAIAFVTDAGTPAVSDPGAILVRAARDTGSRVTPVPGPCAAVAAVSACGLAGGGFCFLGFLPRTPGKLARALESALAGGRTVAFHESAVRLARTLEIAAPVLGEREVVVARELTKIHETFHAGTAAELARAFRDSPPRGECTVLVAA